MPTRSGKDAIGGRLRSLEQAGVTALLRLPDGREVSLGADPSTRVQIRSARGVSALLGNDHLALAQAFVDGEIEVVGPLAPILPILETLDLEARGFSALKLALAGLGLTRAGERRAVAAHYDRPSAFFLPWLDATRSYSHGFFDAETDRPEDAQRRKLDHALTQLGLGPGSRVLDVGAGWGSFLECAARRGIEVHGLTISREQKQFCDDMIERERLPARVELADFYGFAGDGQYDAAVFMGSLEHLPRYDRVTAKLYELLHPAGRVYADFCAQRDRFEFGRFMRRYIWGGPTRYVDPAALVRAFLCGGWNVHELADDTPSYALTCRHWADSLRREYQKLAEQFDEADLRVFQLYLEASAYFFGRNLSQAYHVVFGREARPLPASSHTASASEASAQPEAKRSPTAT